MSYGRVNVVCSVLIGISLLALTMGSVVNPRSEPFSVSTMESFKQCLVSSPVYSFGYCLGMGALSKLQSIDNDPEFDVVDGVIFERGEEQQVRETPIMGRNGADFRTIVDSIGDVFSRRNLRWDMSFLYPGLTMRMAPSVSPAGVLEFVVDPRRELLTQQHSHKDISTGHIVARQFIVPFLTGFKFNVAALLPIIFGLLALIAKKALFLSKIGLIISTAIGLGNLLFGGYKPSSHGSYGYQQSSFNPGFGGHYGYAPHNKYHDNEEDYYRSYEIGNNAQTDEGDENHIRFFEDPGNRPYAREEKAASGRNFAWNDDEKKVKKSGSR